MKKNIILTFLVSAILIFTLLSGSAVAEETAKIILLHTNDMHGQLFPYEKPKIVDLPYKTGGFAYLAALIKEERARNPGKVLLIDSGDIAQGTIYSNLSGGIPVIEIMNYLRYDLSVIGNHEFDWGEKNLKKMISTAIFPVLSANMIKKETGDFIEGAKPYIVKDINNIRVGIIGLSCTDSSVMGPAFDEEDYYFLSSVETLKTYIPVLKFVHQVDLIIVTSHEGHREDLKLAEAVPEIDIIVGSHSHTLLKEPVLSGGTIILQAGSYTTYLGKLELEFDLVKKEITGYKGKVIKVTDKDIEPDPEVSWMLNNYKNKYSSIAQEQIGETSVDLIRSSSEESNIGNLTADILREVGNTEIGLINSEGIRQDMITGPVTMEEIYAVFPFDNILVTMELTGNEIRELLEISFNGNHSILQVSGLKSRYDLSRPAGERLIEVMIGDEPLKSDNIYSVATVDFLAYGGDGYKTFKNGKNFKTIVLARDAIVDYFRTNSPVFSQIEGRITFE